MINMDSIMNTSFNESSSKVEVSFKKTVLIRDYETEVIEASTYIDLDESITGMERMVIVSILEAQMEYSAYINLRAKSLVTETEFNLRKKALEEEINILKLKADKMLGVGVINKYIKDVGE